MLRLQLLTRNKHTRVFLACSISNACRCASPMHGQLRQFESLAVQRMAQFPPLCSPGLKWATIHHGPRCDLLHARSRPVRHTLVNAGTGTQAHCHTTTLPHCRQPTATLPQSHSHTHTHAHIHTHAPFATSSVYARRDSVQGTGPSVRRLFELHTPQR